MAKLRHTSAICPSAGDPAARSSLLCLEQSKLDARCEPSRADDRGKLHAALRALGQGIREVWCTPRSSMNLRIIIGLAALATLGPCSSNETGALLPRYYGATHQQAPNSSAPGCRVLLMGDSIIEQWPRYDAAFFAIYGRINRGIAGQTTLDMLARLPADLEASQPNVILILAGTNDVAGNSGPTSEQEIADRIMSMADFARTRGVNVILVSVLPTRRYPWNPAEQPAQRIVRLNSLLEANAERRNHHWLDLHSRFSGPDKGLRKELTKDGVHLNAAGYRELRRALEPLLNSTCPNALPALR